MVLFSKHVFLLNLHKIFHDFKETWKITLKKHDIVAMIFKTMVWTINIGLENGINPFCFDHCWKFVSSPGSNESLDAKVWSSITATKFDFKNGLKINKYMNFCVSFFKLKYFFKSCKT